MEHPQRDPQRLSALYQYHNAPEVAPAHGLEYDDTIHSASSDKYPVVHDRHYDPPHHSKMYNNDRPPRIIFGMKVRTFLLVALVMVLLVVSAAVGGAVGGKNMRENHVQQDAWPASTEEASSGSSSTSPPSTIATSISAATYSAAVPTYTPLNPCPDANNTRYTSTQPNDQTIDVSRSAGLNFTRYCNVDSPFESSSASAAKKISEAFVYSLDDCIELCASFNFWTKTDNCTVAVYDVKRSRPGNCWIGSASEVETRGSEEKDGVAVAMISM